jgi:hypothetical protein
MEVVICAYADTEFSKIFQGRHTVVKQPTGFITQLVANKNTTMITTRNMYTHVNGRDPLEGKEESATMIAIEKDIVLLAMKRTEVAVAHHITEHPQIALSFLRDSQ